MKHSTFTLLLLLCACSSQIIAQDQYDKVYSNVEGMSLVLKNNLYGYIDQYGQEIVKPQYIKAGSFSEGLAIVQAGRLPGKAFKWGVIDKNGNVVIDFIYQQVGQWYGSFEGGLVSATLPEGIGLIDRQGKMVIPFKYGSIFPFRNGMAMVSAKQGGLKYGFVDRSGKEIVAPAYHKTEDFSEGMAVVGKEVRVTSSFSSDEGDVLYGYVDISGAEVIPLSYVYAGKFSDGMASVKKDGQRFFINKKNEVVLKPDYETSYNSFNDGLCGVEKVYDTNFNKRYGFINKSGKLTIPFDYNEITPFNGGVAAVRKGELWGVIDTRGKIVAPFEYSRIMAFKEGMAQIQKDGLWGFINANGNIVIECIWSEVNDFKNGVGEVYDRNKKIWHRMDKRGAFAK